MNAQTALTRLEENLSHAERALCKLKETIADAKTVAAMLALNGVATQPKAPEKPR